MDNISLAWMNGFMQRCADYGVDGREVLRKQADAEMSEPPIRQQIDDLNKEIARLKSDRDALKSRERTRLAREKVEADRADTFRNAQKSYLKALDKATPEERQNAPTISMNRYNHLVKDLQNENNALKADTNVKRYRTLKQDHERVTNDLYTTQDELNSTGEQLASARGELNQLKNRSGLQDIWSGSKKLVGNAGQWVKAHPGTMAGVAAGTLLGGWVIHELMARKKAKRQAGIPKRQ